MGGNVPLYPDYITGEYMHSIVKILTKTQNELYDSFFKMFEKYGQTVLSADKYIISIPRGEGTFPIVTAHLDKIGETPTLEMICVNTKNGNLSTQAWPKASNIPIGGDDRCGLYIIARLYREFAERCIFALFKDEEKGGIGSRAITKEHYDMLKPKTSCIIGVDRRGTKEYVDYNKGNEEMEKVFKNLGYAKSVGSFSDCSTLASEMKKPCINMSCGFVNEHMSTEVIIVSELENAVYSLTTAIPLLANKVFEFKESVVSTYGIRRGSRYRWDDDYDSTWSYKSKDTSSEVDTKMFVVLELIKKVSFKKPSWTTSVLPPKKAIERYKKANGLSDKDAETLTELMLYNEIVIAEKPNPYEYLGTKSGKVNELFRKDNVATLLEAKNLTILNDLREKKEPETKKKRQYSEYWDTARTCLDDTMKGLYTVALEDMDKTNRHEALKLNWETFKEYLKVMGDSAVDQCALFAAYDTIDDMYPIIENVMNKK